MTKFVFNFEDNNVLFITLDSCRFDTFQKAITYNIDKIAKVKKAETTGNFTYPAHVSFFIGYLPNVKNKSNTDFYTRNGKMLWRLSKAKYKLKKVGILLDGHDIFEGYRKRGYTIRGFGGMNFFMVPNKNLRIYFKKNEFTFFGKNTLNRTKNILPLFNINKIIKSIKNKAKWVLFINEVSTHWPYYVTREDYKSIKSILEIQEKENLRSGVYNDELLISSDGEKLFNVQVKTIELIDLQIKKLLDKLPSTKPIIVVICGDHGTSFGEGGYWGHGHCAKEVLEVPLIINTNYIHKK